MRRAVPYSISMLAVALFAGVASGDVTIDARVGADDFIRPGSIVPVRVMLTNDEETRRGAVQVILSGLMGEDIVGVMPVDLPPQSRKSVFVYVPAPVSMTDRARIQYTVGGDDAIAEIEKHLRTIESSRRVLAVVGEGAPPRSLPPVQREGFLPYQMVMLAPEQIPDRSDGLNMLDVILMAPTPYTPLERDRVQALNEWVLRGGTLIIDASRRSDAFTQGTLNELMPFLPQTEVSGVLTQLGSQRETVYARGTLHGGDVLLESDGDPLIVQAHHGLGDVVVFAVSPGDPVFTNWKGAEGLWKRVLTNLELDRQAETNLLMPMTTPEYEQARLTELVTAEPQTSVRLGVVLLLTILYALAVGPGDYLFIKWIGRPKLTWVTFPLIVAVFTGLAYFGARAWVGGELSTMNAQRILILPEQQQAFRYDIMSMFSPATGRYTLTREGETPLYPLQSYMEPDTLVVDNATGGVEVRIPIWQRRYMVTNQAIEEHPPVTLRVEAQPGSRVPRATVENGSDETLRNCHLAYKDRTFTVQDLGPGQSATLVLEEGMGQPLDGAYLGALSGLHSELKYVAHAHELNLRPALKRGAVAFIANDAGYAPCTLVVDGESAPSTGPRAIVVVAHAG